MNWAASEREHSVEQVEQGEVRLVAPAERAHERELAERDGFLVVEVEPPGPALRGRLALAIENAVEGALERRGAAPPGVGASSDLDASLSDQLFRARQIGRGGLFVCCATLEGIANLAGTLDAEDSAVIRWWMAAAAERSVRLLLDAQDRFLGVYGAPTALHALVEQHDAAPPSRPREAPNAAPEVAASVAAMDLSDLPPAVAPVADEAPDWMVEETPAGAELLPPDAEALSTPPPATDMEPVLEAEDAPPRIDEPAGHVEERDLASAMAAIFDDAPDVPEAESALPPAVEEAYTGWAQGVAESVEGEPEAVAEPEPQPEPVAEAVAETANATTEAEAESETANATTGTETEAEEPATGSDAEAGFETDVAGTTVAESEADAGSEIESEAEPAPDDENLARARSEWRTWMRELDSARGPKPLAVIERMFVSSYVPLSDAVARGVADGEAEHVLETWAASFEKSYSEAFDALRLRGKRPTMVLDVPEVAHRIGRLHGARAVQLLLVDGMRFDLGLRVQERLKMLMGQNAALTERLLLWSALPTTTAVQLELIGRGPDGLREPIEGAESTLPVARGRSAGVPRRIKTGHREVLKLDLVESHMAVAGESLAPRLDALANEVAESVANHFLKLPPRTLVMLFGDHGFVTEPQSTGTSPASHGGASPEEVLVPGFAWLVGSVH
jgi:hypothetical protein